MATSDRTSLSPAGASVLFALPALGAGGSERVVTSIANHWAAAGRSVGVVTFEAEAEEPYYPLTDGVSLTRLGAPAIPKPKWRALLQTWRRIGALRGRFADPRPDVVISFLTKMNVMSVFAAGPLGVPVIVSERNNPKLQQFDPLWRRARAAAFPKAAAFVTMTDEAAAFYPANQRPNTAIIPNPVSLPPGWTNKRRGGALAAVGRLDRQKRFDLLIGAFARVAEAAPDWRLVIWGEGEERERLEALRDEVGLAGRVELPGVTPRPGGWIETADAFILSSDYEGWPNALAEAMAAGLPIVSTDCEFGTTSLIDHERTGLLTPVGDVDAMADALKRFLGDADLRRRLAANAAEEAKQYTVEAIAAKWDAVIAGALARGAPRRWTLG